MRIKLRFSNGAPVAILTLEDESSIRIPTFLAEVKSKGNIPLDKDIQIRYGFPPKVLGFSGLEECTLDALGVKLDGEQLVVDVVAASGGDGPAASTTPLTAYGTRKTSAALIAASTSGPKSHQPSAATTPQVKPRPQPKKSNLSPVGTASGPSDSDPPTVSLAHRGTVVLRVMEDDNSCLFNAVSYVAASSQFSAYELRSFVASTIQAEPVEYNAGILGEDPDRYCEWITMETSWGGGIELKILANFFDLEIISMDVGTGHVYRFNEGKKKKKSIVIYSGIHYDALALSPPSDFVPGAMSEPGRDITIFEWNDDEVVQAGKKLLDELKQRRYHTDTQNFQLRCNVCKMGFKGQKQAVEHAKKTGHGDFGEYD